MGAQQPAAPNFTSAAQQTANSANQAADRTTRANRPNQVTPFSTVGWSQDKQGNWTQTTSLSPELQAATTGAAPIDWNQFGTINDGAAARDQAIDASFGAARARLDPMWDQREAAQRTRLANQGLDPNSAAARNADRNLGMARDDSYQMALANAIRSGTEAGNSVFQNSMTSRQQAIAEALRARGMPFEDIQRASSLLGGAPGFMGASGQRGTDFLGAAGMQNDDAWRRYIEQQRQAADTASGVMSGVGSLGQLALFASDARLKRSIRRLPAEAMPGVPFATWEWADGSGRGFGVIAQDMQRAAPHLVHRRSDGMLLVDYSFR